MTNQVPNTQLSSKVNSDTLDLMYNNFTKIVDWVVRGKDSQFPMPGARSQASPAPKLLRSTPMRCARMSPLCWLA